MASPTLPASLWPLLRWWLGSRASHRREIRISNRAALWPVRRGLAVLDARRPSTCKPVDRGAAAALRRNLAQLVPNLGVDDHGPAGRFERLSLSRRDSVELRCLRRNELAYLLDFVGRAEPPGHEAETSEEETASRGGRYRYSDWHHSPAHLRHPIARARPRTTRPASVSSGR